MGNTERGTEALKGIRAIVTGANSGLGLFTALGLAKQGASVVLACRNQNKAIAAVQTIREQAPDADLVIGKLDLSDLSSVSEFVQQELQNPAPLHLLINNAGIMAVPQAKTTDGFEAQFGTNHLGHFALTLPLINKLEQTGQGRVVTLTSMMARMGKINFEDLQSQNGYSRWTAYEQSKLANQVFALELQRRLKGSGSSVLSVASHPGYSATELQSNDGPIYERLFMGLGNRLVATSADYGAQPTLMAATKQGLTGGELFGPTKMNQMRGPIGEVPVAGRAKKLDVANRLWEVSEELTGVSL